MLQAIDLNQHLPRKVYKRELLRAQLQLRQLAYQLYLHKRSLVVVFEGMDGAGKSRTIKALIERLDPRGYEVYIIAPPEGEERSHHYLWRFWRCLLPPDKKQVLIFNRSWYGRVLDDRVEGVYPKSVWRRAYREINEFERQLAECDIIIAKFWLHISPEEQRRRLETRTQDTQPSQGFNAPPQEHYTQWELYAEAVEDMLLRTNTVTAPWTIVESDDKRYARVKTLQTLVELLKRELNYEPEDLLRTSQAELQEQLYGLFEPPADGEPAPSSFPMPDAPMV